MSDQSAPAAKAPWRDNAPQIAIVAGTMAIGAAYACFVGEDVNWDWQNYHEYNVWAILNGRYDHDVIAPGFQTYFNPIIYFPWYYLRHTLPPAAAGAIIGAVHGLNLALIWWLTRNLLGNAANALTIGAAILLAACGPMTLSEVGTSFSDILTSIPIIAGLALLLARDDPRPMRYVLVGALIGLAVGFKLTNIVYALGLAMAGLAAARPLMAMSCLAVGGAIGSVIAGGTWSLMLWREFGNPFFPLFNSFFPSPEMQQLSILDRQFIPRSFLDGLAYPFYWLVGDFRSSERPFRDARFALLAVLMLIAIGARLRAATTRLTRRDLQLLIFLTVSFAAWLALFAIQRYAVTLELLCAPAIVLLLVRISSSNGAGAPPRALDMRSSIAILAIAAISAAWTQPGDWGRRPWSNPYQPAIPAQLSQPATYFLLDKPLSFLAPLLPAGSRFYTIIDQALPIKPGGVFDRRIRAGLNDPLPGGMWGVHVSDRQSPANNLADYGLMVDASKACLEIEGPYPVSTVVVCPLTTHKP